MLYYSNVISCLFQMPSNEAEWSKVEEGFANRWQFPNCIGAVDGKHIYISPITEAGSAYRNYKGSSSLVLMAVVDARYRFIAYDLGAEGSASDSGIWNRCSLKTGVDNNTIHLPPPKPLEAGNDATKVPHVFVGDDAFALSPNMMKPFRHSDPNRSDEQRIFSYRLSRARRVVENAFGILANRFRILLNAMLIDKDNVKIVVLACMALHNMLLEEFAQDYVPPGYADTEDTAHGNVIPGEWRATGEQMTSANVGGSAGRHPSTGKQVRQRFVDYFMGSGAVSWQRRMANLE